MHKGGFALSIENVRKGNTDLENEYLEISLESILDSLKKRKFREKIISENYILYKYHSHWVYYTNAIENSETFTEHLISLWSKKIANFLDKGKKIKFQIEISKENEEKLKKELKKKAIIKIII